MHRGRGVGEKDHPLEVAATQMCKEARARDSTNLQVWDIDLAEVNNLDGRFLGVVQDCFTPWHGAQFAIDTTLVPLLGRDGSLRIGAVDHDGAALDDARRRKGRIYLEMFGDVGRARLEVLVAELGGKWSVETAKFLVSLAMAEGQDSSFRERFSFLVSRGRVLCVVAGRPPSAWSRGYPCSA